MTKYFFCSVLLAILILENNLIGEELWSGNGHYYAIFRQAGITWEDAKNAAENSYNSLGWQGYLATITSPEEQAFLSTSSFLGASYNLYGDLIWLGGYDASMGSDTEWTWITAEEWSYTNWAGQEPNNLHNPNENYLMMSGGQFGAGVWFDKQNNALSVGTASNAYIVEYSAPAAVPEPSVMALFVFGIGWIIKACKK